jgi:hypothetical protein
VKDPASQTWHICQKAVAHEKEQTWQQQGKT